MKFREQQHRLGECFRLTKTLNVENETMYPVQDESRTRHIVSAVTISESKLTRK